MADNMRDKILQMMEQNDAIAKAARDAAANSSEDEEVPSTIEEQMALFQKQQDEALAKEWEDKMSDMLEQVSADYDAKVGDKHINAREQDGLSLYKNAKKVEVATTAPAKENTEEQEAPEKKANLWGGRFTKPTEKKVYDFNASITFDKTFYYQDILGSMAHVSMLEKVGILTKEEKDQLVHALADIQEEVETGKLVITDAYEDIHSFVEAQLIERLGDVGKKVHTGRSRNDQVALDMRLYTRTQVLLVDDALLHMLDVLFGMMKENIDTIMPGFTHLQKAQPTTLAHHLGAYFEMFKRDRSRMEDIYHRMNYCPLGSGAFAGTTYPLDRAYTADLLGFFGPTLNSMDGVSDRDYLIEFLSALATIMMHLSRFSEEVILWNSNEYRFVEIDDAYSTGSSIMPQKKNPDIAELVRGKTGRVYGALMSLLTTMKGIPLAYNKDMQEDKQVAFDAFETVKDCLELFADMLETMKFNKDRMADSAKNGFTNATDAADYLVNHGMPFRDAHGVIGEIVLYCLDKNISIDQLSLEELKKFSNLFEEDIYDAISMETCVNKRLTIGAPGHQAMEGVLATYDAYLRTNWQDNVEDMFIDQEED